MSKSMTSRSAADKDTGTATTAPEDTGADGDAAADAGELGAAGAQLSTAPREDSAPNLPSLGVVGWLRWCWRQLTSMRVALLLLLLLSLAAIPGSLIPQTSDLLKVGDFQKAHTTLAPIYEKLGLFHVYSSVWFSAIYILLFLSLIGCIIPRSWQFVGQLRSRPPGAPRNLARLPAHTTWRTAASPEEVQRAALTALRRRRYRAHLTGDAVAAEKGYLREAGNLLFHIALIVMLIAFATGQLLKSEGNKLILEGDGFANTLTQYDDFKSGNLFDVGDLPSFSFTLHNFVGTYERKGPNRGTPQVYYADLDYSQGAEGKQKKARVEVNKPLNVDGSKIFLIGHGYAPEVTVRNGKGKVVYQSAVPLLPIDNNQTSTGAIKVMDGYTDGSGKKEQLGFNAFFVPTFAGSGSGTMFSQFPGADAPVLALSAYHGSLGVDAGLPQNVYQLDTAHMKQFKDAKGRLLKQRLTPGQTMKLPNGAGSITFGKNIQEWASFQISHQPGEDWALTGAIAAIAGLAGSLFIQRRRVWVRAVRGPDGLTVVEMAGLGRSESPKLPQELGDLMGLVHDKAPTAVPADDAEPGEASASEVSASEVSASEVSTSKEPASKPSVPKPSVPKPSVPETSGPETSAAENSAPEAAAPGATAAEPPASAASDDRAASAGPALLDAAAPSDPSAADDPHLASAEGAEK